MDTPGIYMVLPEKFQNNLENTWKINFNEIIAKELNYIQEVQNLEFKEHVTSLFRKASVNPK